MTSFPHRVSCSSWLYSGHYFVEMLACNVVIDSLFQDLQLIFSKLDFQ
jgi:hypothetical protein